MSKDLEPTPKADGQISKEIIVFSPCSFVSQLPMRTHGYPGYATLCQKASASTHEFARRVLFQYISLIAEEALSGPKKTLKNATTKAIAEPVATENYEFFKTELADGKLASSAVFLFSQFRLRNQYCFQKNPRQRL